VIQVPEATVSVDIDAWRKTIEQVVDGIADEQLQARAWFGIGPEESSPEEMFNQFLGDAAIEEFLGREDNGLNLVQIEAGWKLVKLMRRLSEQTPNFPEFIDPSKMIDDPRWMEIRETASPFSALLSK
jgi:hypothetical protein